MMIRVIIQATQSNNQINSSLNIDLTNLFLLSIE